MGDYNPDYWKCCTGITIEQFCRYMKDNLPPDAVFHVCGCDMFYMHLSNDGSVFTVDDCSLSDLPEYEGFDPSNLTLPEQTQENRALERKDTYTREEIIEMLKEMQLEAAHTYGFFAGHVTQHWVIESLLGQKIKDIGGEPIKVRIVN